MGGRPSGTSGKRKLGSAFPSAHNPPTVIEQSTDLDLDNDSADYIDDEKGSIRKRKVIHSTTSPGECTWCGVKKTAQWRKGPSGSRGLCNVSRCVTVLKNKWNICFFLYCWNPNNSLK